MSKKLPQPKLKDSATGAGLHALAAPYEYPHTNFKITVPTGLEIAPSAPVAIRGIGLSEWHLSPASFLVHAFLYQCGGSPAGDAVNPPQIFTRLQVDSIFRQMLAKDGVGPRRRFAIWLNIRLFGYVAWRHMPGREVAVTADLLPPVPYKSVEGHRTVRYLLHELTDDYQLTTISGHEIRVPKGFQFDLASIPASLWSLLAPNALSPQAALVHDYLYRYQGHPPFGAVEPYRTYSRKEADGLFNEIMARVPGIGSIRRVLAYGAVRLCGRGAWNTNELAGDETPDRS
jgi:hypothetical protein